MEYVFRNAQPDEVQEIFDLYRERVQWMDAVGIAQWNVTNYLEAYPVEYFREQAELGGLYVLVDESTRTIAAAAVLLQSDDLWLDRANTSACYIHSLVTSMEAPGAGRAIMAEIEKLAIRDGSRF